jgi:hypothetical protein
MKHLPKDGSLIASIRSDLAAIRTWISQIHEAIKEHIESEHAAEDRNRDKETARQTINAVVSYDDQAKAAKSTDSNKQYGVQNSIRWAAWMAFAAATIYAAIAAYQVHWMRIATTATQQQLTDARAAQNARLTIELPRPTITEQPNKHIYAKGTIVIKNIGGTPALEPVVDVEFGSGTEPPQWGNYKISIVPNPRNLPISTTAPVELPYDKLVGNDTEMRADRQYASFLIQVAYRDVYGATYSFSACYLYAPQFRRFYHAC